MSEVDIVVEVSEDFINESLGVFYDEPAFPKKFSGVYRMELPLIGDKYSQVKYVLRFNEPLKLDSLSDSFLNVCYNAELELVYGWIKIEADVSGLVTSKPVYNRGRNQLELNIVEIELVDIRFYDFIDIPGYLVESINKGIRDIVKDGLGELDNVPISPIIGNLSLPEMPEGNKFLLTVGFGEVNVISEDRLLLAFNISAEGEGERAKFVDLENEGDVGVRVSEAAIDKVINFWWKHTTFQKSMPFKGKIEIKNVDELMDTLSNYSVELLPKFFSLGFIEIDCNLMEVWLDYEGVFAMSKPEIEFDEDSMNVMTRSIIDLTAFLRVDLDVAVELDTSGAIPDDLTPWIDDRVIGNDRRVFQVMRYRANKKQVDIVGDDTALILDDEQRIVLDLSGFDIDLGLNWRLPRPLVRRIEKNIEKQVKLSFPSVPLSPSLVKHELEGSDLMVEMDVLKIEHGERDITVHANVDYVRD